MYGAILHGDRPDGCDKLNLSVAGEWIVATLFNFYMLSFAIEFKSISFSHPAISVDKCYKISNSNGTSDASCTNISTGIDNIAFTQSNEFRYIENYV